MSMAHRAALLASLLVGCATAGGNETTDSNVGSDASIDANIDASVDAPDAGPCNPEVCNGDDDDCDGVIDEDIAPLECGVGECGVTAPGCVGGVPGTCTPSSAVAETCNNLDDDCDGTPDNKPDLTCGKGICANTAPACVNGANGTCTPGTPQTEICNMLDDNCDGTADNKAPLSCGVGECANTAPACLNGADNTCTPKDPKLEICSNGLDEDCNGSDLTPPSNKTCPNWLVMTTGTTNGDNTCSGADITPSPQGDCAAGEGTGNDSVYAFGSNGGPYRWTVTMTGPAGYDTLMHVHSSTSCNMGDQLACSDDYMGNLNVSQVVVDGLPNNGGYYVVADSRDTNNNRAYTLQLSGVTLALDTCSEPAPIRGNGDFKYSTSTMTNTYTPPAGCTSGASASPDVVYSITARKNGTITASTSGTNFDTMLYVSTTCGSGSITCNDDVDSSNQYSEISWSATTGTTYYIVVDGYDSAAKGNYTLTISGY